MQKSAIMIIQGGLNIVVDRTNRDVTKLEFANFLMFTLHIICRESSLSCLQNYMNQKWTLIKIDIGNYVIKIRLRPLSWAQWPWRRMRRCPVSASDVCRRRPRHAPKCPMTSHPRYVGTGHVSLEQQHVQDKCHVICTCFFTWPSWLAVELATSSIRATTLQTEHLAPLPAST